MVKFSDFAESFSKRDEGPFKRRLSQDVDSFTSETQISVLNNDDRNRRDDYEKHSQICLTDALLITDYLKDYESSKQYLNKYETTQTKRALDYNTRDFRFSFGLDYVVTALISAICLGQSHSDNKPRDEFQDEVETEAYKEAEQKQERLQELTKRISEQSGGLSGSLSDYMFSSHKMDRPTFIIGANDTLVSIAQAFFQESLLAFLIADLNSDRSIQYEKRGKRYVELKSRDVLKLPIAEDIEDFWKSDTKNLNPNSLITVVRENLIDREVVEAHLKPVLVAPSKPISSIWPELKLMEVRIKTKSDQGKFSEFSQTGRRSRVKLRSIIHSGIKVGRSIDI